MENSPENTDSQLQEEQQILNAVPKGFKQCLRFSLQFFEANSKPLLLISTLTGIPHLIGILLFFSFYPDWETQKQKIQVFTVMTYSLDIFRENFSDVLILLAIPLGFYGLQIRLKDLTQVFFEKYVHRVAMLSVLLIMIVVVFPLAGFWIVYNLQFFVSFLLLLAPFYSVFFREKGGIFEAIKHSAVTALPLILWIVPGVLLINLITRLPEYILTTFFLYREGALSERIVQMQNPQEFSDFLLRLAFNFPLSISVTLSKILVQPFKSLFYCFLFLIVAKKFFPQEMMPFFRSQKPESSNNAN